MNKLLLTTIGLLCLFFNSYSQNVFDPNDPVTNYSASTAPRVPGADTIIKWVRTPHSRVTWDTRKFKPYLLNDMAFRLRYPNGYNANDNTKKYPLIIFFHGGGEIGPITDNEFHLLWGAQMFEQMINDGKFNAYLLFPQQKTVGWEETYFTRINMIIDSLQKYGHVDPDRIIPMGLSIGGNGVLYYSMLYPQRTALAIPSSPSWIETFVEQQNKFKHIPVWIGSGGQDPNPHPAGVQKFVDSFNAKGADVRWSLFPSLGHVCWNEQWSQPYLAPYWNAAHKANPIVFFKRTQFCPDTAVNATIGITQNFYAYQWQKDGNTIAESEGTNKTIYDAASLESFDMNEITVKLTGTYRVRFKRSATAEWSDWSPNPAVISHKPYTITPDIQVTGLKSRVLPSADGSTTVPLELPAGYATYTWKDANTDAVVSTTRNFVAGPGTYIATVTQANTCGSKPSPVFTVVDANGDPKPDTVFNLAAVRTSSTSIQLTWTQNPAPASEETGFEIYRSATAGGPYTLVSVAPAGATSFINFNLAANTNYFYVVRSINETGASVLTSEVSLPLPVPPPADVTAPTVPANLSVVSVTTNSASLDWDNSTDNIGVTGYDVYVDGVKKLSTMTSDAVVTGLAPNTSYSFTVKALDSAGNASAFSAAATGKTNQAPDITAPSVPANLKVVSVTTTSVSLDWDNSTDNVGVIGYDVYVNGVKNTSSISSDAVVSGLTQNTTYSFTVKAVDAAGNASAFSTAVNGKTNQAADVTAPSVPANLKVVSVTTTSVSLDWDNSTDNVGVTGYDIYVDGVKKMSSTTSNAVVTGLSSNTSYSFTVKALDLAGNISGFSNAVTGKTTQAADVTAPSVPQNVKVVSVTSNSINLNWDNSTDNVGVVSYDVYVGGVKKYNTLTSEVSAGGLSPNTSYTFTVKALDAAGNASGFSTSVIGKTAVFTDNVRPAAPANLKVVYTSRSSVELDWDKSTDNIGVVRYDVYVNGVKKYTTANTDIEANNLTAFKNYLFYVVAADQAGNLSPISNIVAGKTELDGLKYSYYEGAWSVLPNFDNLNPVKEGITENINLGDRRTGVNENFGFVWQGYIKIPSAGTYTFETVSDDGSKLYFNKMYSPAASPLVNNDGLHSEKSVSNTVYISSAGVYPFAVTFFERTGDEVMKVYWKGPGIRRQEIPASAFSDQSSDFNWKKNNNRDWDHYFDGHGNDDEQWWDKFFSTTSGNELAEQPLNPALSSEPQITKAYPSPFVDRLNIDFTNQTGDSKVDVNVYDIYGKLVHVQHFNGLPAGRTTLNVDMSNRQLNAGVYMVRMYVNGVPSKILKLVKAAK